MPEGMNWARVRHLTLDFSARLSPEDHQRSAGFLHFCDEWDGLLIDKSDPEFDCCGCLFRYPDYDPFTGKKAPLLIGCVDGL